MAGGEITLLVLKSIFEAIRAAQEAKPEPDKVEHPCLDCSKPAGFNCFKCGEYK